MIGDLPGRAWVGFGQAPKVVLCSQMVPSGSDI